MVKVPLKVAFNPDEHIVSMIEWGDEIYVATNYRIFRYDDNEDNLMDELALCVEVDENIPTGKKVNRKRKRKQSND